MRELERQALEPTTAQRPAEPGAESLSGMGTEPPPAARRSPRQAPGTQPPPAPGAQRSSEPGAVTRASGGIAVVGAGRVGRALAGALGEQSVRVLGPYGREARSELAAGVVGAPGAILLCVPDTEIQSAAQAVAGLAPLVGHTSGATPLAALEPAGAEERFGLHPLQTFTGSGGDARRLAGAGCAVAGSSGEALEFARALAETLGLVPFELRDRDRAAYHAAAATASNFLVTLQSVAEELAGTAGLGAEDARRALAPLVRATVENWVAGGPEAALTGPVARGDERTVDAHRAAVNRHDPGLLPLFDALVARTRTLAGRAPGASPEPPPAEAGRSREAALPRSDR